MQGRRNPLRSHEINQKRISQQEPLRLQSHFCLLLLCQDSRRQAQSSAREMAVEFIPLNAHTLKVLSDPALRSFLHLDPHVSVALRLKRGRCRWSRVNSRAPSESTETSETSLSATSEKVTYYDMTKVVEIAENTRSIVRSLKRNDARIQQRISSKYGKRRSERVKQIIHRVTKEIVTEARRTTRP